MLISIYEQIVILKVKTILILRVKATTYIKIAFTLRIKILQFFGIFFLTLDIIIYIIK